MGAHVSIARDWGAYRCLWRQVWVRAPLKMTVDHHEAGLKPQHVPRIILNGIVGDVQVLDRLDGMRAGTPRALGMGC